MNPLLLLLALLLPWLAGAAALWPLRKGLGLNIAGWLGYGYFLGAALLTLGAMLAGLLPGLATVISVTLCLGALTLACSLAAARVRRLLPPAESPALGPAAPGEYWLGALLLLLTVLHLGFAAHELYWRPVYPWDAWQTWLYMAKVWFFSGGPVDLLAPTQWQAAGDVYTVQGHHYPRLLPTQSWWLASMMGQWQESRVTWVALPAAIALGLALWGQAVATTGRWLAGAVAAWLLLSLPLLQTHISLAGYADLWLAGFSGLGLIAVLRGLLQAHTGQLLLGAVALALGLLVKHDAVIWLVCGLALVFLLRQPRLTTAALALFCALAVALLVAWLLRFDLQLHPVFSNYWRHLWLADSWHLLWYLLPAALLLALLPGSPTRAAGKVIGLLLVGLMASQLFLFGATSAGAWATDGTAVNRLLLQIAPLLVFALVCLAAAGRENAAAEAALPPPRYWRRSTVALLAGTLCLLLLLAAWLQPGTGTRAVPAASFPASQLRVVEGPLRHLGDRMVLPPAAMGHAIVSTGPVRFDARELDLLTVALAGAEERRQTLFWRTAASPDELFSRGIAAGSGQLPLRGDSNWRGSIIEVGMVLYPDPEQPLTLREFHFEPASPTALLGLATSDWLTPSYWTQASINQTRLGTASGLLSLPVLGGLWVLFTWLALRLLTGAQPPLAPLLGVVLFAWLLLDLRWLHNSYHQALATRAHYGTVSAEQRDALDLGNDVAILDLARQASAALGPVPRRILLAADGEHQRFALRRLKYALLPHAAHIHNRPAVPRRFVSAVDAIIWLSDTEPGAQPAQCSQRLQRMGMRPALITPRGTLCMPPATRSTEARVLEELNR